MTSKQESGFAHFLVILIVSGLGALVITSLIPVNRHYNDGKSAVAGVYLAKGGDDDGSSEPAKVEKIELQKPEKNQVEIKQREENSRAEVKTTPEKFKSEVRQGDLRVKYEIENGKVKLETKFEKEDVSVATAPGQMALVNKRVGALSSFPLLIDPTTKGLTVTTSTGTKTVAVLPQQAVDNMLASGVMSSVVGEKVNNNLASIPSLVKLEVEDGVLGYKVKGVKVHRLFGLIPVKAEVEAFVSAENGQVIGTNESFLSKILKRVSL